MHIKSTNNNKSFRTKLAMFGLISLCFKSGLVPAPPPVTQLSYFASSCHAKIILWHVCLN